MAHYYTTGWASGTTLPAQKQRVSWGPALGVTAVLLGVLGLAAFLFPASSGGPFEDAVVYVDSGTGYGSGMVIDAKRGYILTNRHVVIDPRTHQQRAATFKITLYRGTDHPKEAEAIIKETSQEWTSGDSLAHDWAVLEINKGEQPQAEVHFSDSLQVHARDPVVAWGWPVAALPTARPSQKPGAITEIDQTKPGAPYKIIKHDASLAGGNSGGPLTAADGTVIGMNTAGDVVEHSAAPGNTNYAIPTHILKPVVLDKYAHFKIQ